MYLPISADPDRYGAGLPVPPFLTCEDKGEHKDGERIRNRWRNTDEARKRLRGIISRKRQMMKWKRGKKKSGGREKKCVFKNKQTAG